MMTKFNTNAFDWIENVPASSVVLREKIKNILQMSETCSANVTNLDLATGNFQITLKGSIKKDETIHH